MPLIYDPVDLNMDEIYNRFRTYVSENKLILPGEKVLLSLSAGKDSMFMLHMLLKLQNELSFTMGIFHLNHLTRGEETDKDEEFVREKSIEFNLPCFIESFNFKLNQTKGLSFEEHAREVRYSLLEKIFAANGYTKIATAHNMNDNGETVLMRILSGTGIAGIKGILPVLNVIIRPVLFAEKNEIYSYLRNNNIDWREDLSNKENLYLRNYLRNKIIPAVLDRFPQAEENLSNLAGHAIENYNLVLSLADRLYPDVIINKDAETLIDVEDFHEDIPLIKFYISKVLYDKFRIKMKISIYNEIIRRYKSTQANMILYEKNGLTARKGLLNDRIVIYISDKTEVRNEPELWEYQLSQDYSSKIYIKEIRKELEIISSDYDYYNKNRERRDIIFIQPEDSINKIIIRNRRPGDRIRTKNGTKKIKELMIEKKLDSRIKNNIPLIVADNHIAAYLPGLLNTNNNRVACNFHILNDTKRILAFFFRDY